MTNNKDHLDIDVLITRLPLTMMEDKWVLKSWINPRED